ncbi:MAG: SDR family NAD(P)-dependent oxidoreductase [Sphingobacteriales bacterium]|nr:MAG: SDR family NAD(P)-dependent oxidoreductase [Sphingobacteriales bacterium]
MTRFKNASILLTGASGDVGLALLQECVRRGAKRVYAADAYIDKLKPFAEQHPGIVVPLALDLSSERDILRSGGSCDDINMLINNGNVTLEADFAGRSSVLKALFEMKVNYIGVLDLINRMLPSLRHHASSSIVNIMSLGSGAGVNRLNTYCASRSAMHVLTHALRDELRAEHIQVFGVYPGYRYRELSPNVLFELTNHEEIAHHICAGIEAGTSDIFPDECARQWQHHLKLAAST